jgi:hypothetical protein
MHQTGGLVSKTVDEAPSGGGIHSEAVPTDGSKLLSTLIL